jgi:hypothetical protein
VCIKVQESLVCRDVSGDGVAWWDVGGGVMWEFNLGAWTGFLTAVLTAYALVFARRAWKASQESAQAARDMYNLESRREKARAQELERTAQADLVAAWIESKRLDVDLGFKERNPWLRPRTTVYSLRISNESKLPVYDVKITYLGLGPIEVRGTDVLDQVPPGGVARPTPDDLLLQSNEAQATTGDVEERVETPTDLRVELRFTDSAQRRWIRGVDGRLDREEEANEPA